jgi:outer membrane protein assembly factor BamD (BamD/ComL family)
MFEIATFWLEDTRKEMRESDSKDKGQLSWLTRPESLDLIHLEKSKPLFDEEGRALEKLEQVRYNDMTGPLADKALFLAGGVRFYRGDYKDAERSYSQLIELYPNSPFVNDAIKLALISKQLATGGAAYDARKLAEARRLVDMAYRNYPDLVAKESGFLDRQLFSITMQQAEKDYQMAEFYKRTGHPCSAYFCYEIVRRRYPGTKYFDMAAEQMQALRSKVEKAQHDESGKQSSGEGADVSLQPQSSVPNGFPGQPGFLPQETNSRPLPLGPNNGRP